MRLCHGWRKHRKLNYRKLNYRHLLRGISGRWLLLRSRRFSCVQTTPRMVFVGPTARRESQSTAPAPSLELDAVLKYSRYACTGCRARRRSGFFYTPFLSRNRGIQFYGFRVRAVQDSCWFAVHARIGCMTNKGQSTHESTRFIWNTACDPRTYGSVLRSPAAIPAIRTHQPASD